MSTIGQCASTLANGDMGRWREAIMRAAEILAPTWDPGRAGFPEQQTQLCTAALLVYAIAGERNVPAASLSREDLLAWLPNTTSVTELSLFSEPLLKSGLRAAGHDLPEPGPRNETRLSANPVVAQWQRLVNWADHYPPDYEESVADDPGPSLIWAMISVRGTLNGRSPTTRHAIPHE